MIGAFPRPLLRPLPALARLLLIAVGTLLWAAPAALASSATSVNWAGYAAHRSGVRFRFVSAEWTVPIADCTAVSPGYSSVWVGLGGYGVRSGALEQTGIAIDCSPSGRSSYLAWYELVPAASHSVALGVKPGDLIRGAVSASGHEVTISLEDLTDNRAFRRTFSPSRVDATSAEWIVEAPSQCTGSGECFALPLADFGHVHVFGAHATTTGGRSGTVASRRWSTTEITLLSRGFRFIADNPDQAGQAVPSDLTADGSAFTVTYRQSPSEPPGPPGPFLGPAS